MITLIKNGIVITMDEKRKEQYEKLDVVIKDDVIYKVVKDYDGEYDKLIDAKGLVVMPGLINAHTHLGMSIFRATNDNLTLQEWLEGKIWPIENNMTDEDVYYASLLSCIEMIKTGTTCANDMYFGWRGTIKAIKDSKVRAVMSRCLIGSGEEFLDKVNDFRQLVETSKNLDNVTFAVTPHSLYTCPSESLNKCLELSKEYSFPIHVHFCENKSEEETIKNTYNISPVNALRKLGFLERKLILAHGTFISSDDQKLLNSNVSIVTNPISNLNLGCGIADITSYLKNNINVALGTDGQGSGNTLNLFRQLSLVADLQKAKYQDPTVMSSYDALKIATINGAKALDLENKVGSIEEGKKADIIILDINNIEMYPTPDLICQVVHNVESSNIKTTIINGKIVMENRKLMIDVDENKLKDQIDNIYTRLKIN